MKTRPIRLLMLSLSLATLAALSSARAPQRVDLSGSVLPVLTRSRTVGAASPSEVLNLSVSLQPRHPAELQAFCDSVSDPISPNYRQFMTPAEVGEAFGASGADVQSVVAFLKASGMKVTLVADNHMAILAEASVAQAQAAFGIKLQEFSGPDPDGNTIRFRANATPVQLPPGLSKVVIDVFGLESYTRPKHMTTLLTPPLTRTLYQSAAAYASGFHGEGRTVAFSNWVGLRLSNVPLYVSHYSLPVPAGGAGSNIQIVTVGSSGATKTENAEGDLDLQMELGMAPLATILIYDNGTNDLIGILTKEANDNLADVISESYGWSLSSSTATAAHNQHLSMTAQGMTYLAASGDNGTSIGTYFYPDIEPEVLAIGGTIANVDANGNRLTEVAWSGSGGGWSTNSASFNILPAWQVGFGVPTGNNHRLVPDISLHGAGSGTGAYTFYYRGNLTSAYVGTSFSSPVMAGSIVGLEQRLAALNLGPRLGRMQPVIYGENGRNDVWTDITSGSTGSLPDGSTASAHAGWDFTTGWGVPNFEGWYGVLSNRPISGSVVLQGFGTSGAGVPVTVQLYQAGTNNLVDTKATTLDGSGGFTVYSQAPGGSYDVYVKASHWLRRRVANKAFGLPGISGLQVSLLNGDINDDNTVSLPDFGLFKAAYGSSTGEARFDPRCDLNGDGTVSLVDFGIFKSTYGTSGD